MGNEGKRGGGGGWRLVEADRGERREVEGGGVRFVSGDKSLSLGSPVNQRALGRGGGGAVSQLEERRSRGRR